MDYVNTRYWRGSETATETLDGAAALAAWLGREGGAPAAWADRLARLARDNPPAAQRLLDRALELRETIHRLFVARAAGEAVPGEDIARLNAALVQAPSRGRLDGQSPGWIVPAGAIGAERLLAPVLWSAADLLLQGDAARIRQCANEKCRWVFVDASKAGSRRWCTMNSCGNRAKAQRHYHKAKAVKN
ncbi:MAG: ABATE domain-containing protein [Reyranellaceae bacterium]